VRRRAWIAIGLMLASESPARSEVLPSASERFAHSSGTDVPDFQRHVVPLLSRLGCNGRSCHGSFQGQGGFQLSLFGYDFSSDYKALTRETGKRGGIRINPGAPTESLALRKPLEQVDHEGGQRIAPGSWQHHLMLNWIKAGAPGVQRERELSRLRVIPGELLFAKAGESEPLRVIAEWADGSTEDVTCLSRFRANDDSVATVDAEGRVTAGMPGDTHVVAIYDKGVAAIPVIRPRERIARVGRGRTEIDRRINPKLAKLGIQPSELCTDAEFLRRVSIDLTGTLPTPDEVSTFLRDTRPGKRDRKIAELLDRPAYAAWWANKLCDFTGNNPLQQSDMGQEQAVQWYQWIYARLLRNLPYDELVEGMVLARSRSAGASYSDYAREMSSYFRLDKPADFAARATMPHYWSRRALEKPDAKAMAFAHSFLGVQLQCAQCHKHPFDQWSKNDFQQFAKFFEPIRFGVAPDAIQEHQRLAKAASGRMQGGMMMRMGMDMLGRAEAGQTVPWRELYVAQSPRPSEANLLGRRTVKLDGRSDPRKALMDWMREPQNPYFAKAFVNRVWANYFGVGIIEPPDDLNQANPPSNRELLAYLENGFRARGFDMKGLHREIVSSDAYQRSWRSNETNSDDQRNFSRMRPRRLAAEVVYDALAQVTAADGAMVQVRTNLVRRAIGHLSMRMAGTYAMNTFGKPARSTNCDCERNAGTSLLQTLFLKNDPILRNRLSESAWLQGIGGGAPEELIGQAYLRCLGRPPTREEMSRCQGHLEQAASLREGMEDLMWALLNTKEFLMNH